jgi:hypothetical protein
MLDPGEWAHVSYWTALEVARASRSVPPVDLGGTLPDDLCRKLWRPRPSTALPVAKT